MSQYTYTDNSYLKKYEREKVTQEAKASFLVSVNASSSSQHPVDTEFSSSSIINSIENKGGQWPSITDNWNPWAQSVQSLVNPACVAQSAQSMDWLFQQFPTLHSKAASMALALEVYFNIEIRSEKCTE